MDAKARTRIEVGTLHGILDEVDYYKLLCLDPDCPQGEIEGAVRRESRTRHPDRVAALGDEGISKQAGDIYQRLQEAGECLSDPDQRAQYDEVLKAGILRMTDDALELAEKERQKADNPEHAATRRLSTTAWG